MKPKDIFYNISTVRTLVFIEKEPNSNIYEQVCLDREQYKQITALLGKDTGMVNEYGDEVYEIKTLEEDIILPDLKDIFNT